MKKHGFTLIELLVVIAIIGLLAGILIPVMSGAQSKARRTQCLANLHSLGQVGLSYASDHRGHLPKIGNGGNYQSLSEMVKGLFEDEYLEDLGVLVCPMDNERQVCAAADIAQFDTSRNCSYLHFAGYNTLKSENGATLPLFCDRARGGVRAGLTEKDNHGAKWRNVVYLDGHTEGLRTAAEANDVVKVDLPNGVTLVD